MNTDSGPNSSSPLPDWRLRDLLEALPEAIVLVNPAGRIAYSNSNADGLFGYGRGELQGQPADLLLPDRYRRDHVADLSGYFDQPRTRSLGIGTELCCARHDGTEFPVEINLIPLDTEEGILVMNTIRDITERKRFEHALNEKNAELEGANKELEAFDYSIAHDLRAPLNRIAGFTAMLAQQYGERLDSRGQELLQHIAEAGRSMDELVGDLLALSTVTRGTLGRRMVDMSALAHSIVTALRKSEPAREVRFDVPAGINVRADPGLLRVVLENLLGNAWKFTAKRRSARSGSAACDAAASDTTSCATTAPASTCAYAASCSRRSSGCTRTASSRARASAWPRCSASCAPRRPRVGRGDSRPGSNFLFHLVGVTVHAPGVFRSTALGSPG